MKLYKRLLTAAIALMLAALTLTSCNPATDVPEGMQLASLENV